jgi:hypothetical protein
VQTSALLFRLLFQDTNGSVGPRVLAKLPALPKLLRQLETEGLLESFWLKHLDARASKLSSYKSSIAVIVLNSLVNNIKDVTKIPKVILVAFEKIVVVRRLRFPFNSRTMHIKKK